MPFSPDIAALEPSARERAAECGGFVADDEDELVSDEPVTCLNCHWRRWRSDGFDCRKNTEEAGV